MGKRGPKPTPTSILKLRGSWRADARVDEPTPPEGVVQAPEWLPADVAAEWVRLEPILQKMGVLTTADTATLARYCSFLVRWRDLSEDPEQTGRALRVSDHLLRIEREFGLTPSARAGMAKKKDNPAEHRGKDRFLKGFAG